MGHFVEFCWDDGALENVFEIFGKILCFLSGTTTLDSDIKMAGNLLNTNEQSDSIFTFHKHSIYFNANFMEIFPISVII
jgi:hypothetical protein